jgi:solute carrier family 25 carnitine/acylcarnitine transporter 20/29
MQTAAPGTFAGMGDCAGKLLKNEGPLAFYKGTLTPLLGIGVCVSIQFGAAERTKRFFVEQNKRRGLGGPDGSLLTGGQLAMSGVAAGLANSVVSGPVEHIRIRTYQLESSAEPDLRSSGLQTQSATNPAYRGPWDAFKKIGGEYGIRGIFKGQGVTLLREASGYAIYFWAYEKLVQREMRDKGIKREELSPAKAVLFGAAAGYAVRIISCIQTTISCKPISCGLLYIPSMSLNRGYKPTGSRLPTGKSTHQHMMRLSRRGRVEVGGLLPAD